MNHLLLVRSFFQIAYIIWSFLVQHLVPALVEGNVDGWNPPRISGEKAMVSCNKRRNSNKIIQFLGISHDFIRRAVRKPFTSQPVGVRTPQLPSPSRSWMENDESWCLEINVHHSYSHSWWWLEHDFYFPVYWECHHPNWLICFRWFETTNQ